ncbi:iridoid oxidase-like [Euphorbia lathyris]|uniref:iridoid oxidase-like n=1 Tax=Euphorbia lathyris TaxID=212925 RepID=UPI0033130FB9
MSVQFFQEKKQIEEMDSNIISWFASSTVLFSITLFLVLKRRQSSKQPPPGPPAWPLIGNIFDLGRNPHQSLYKLRFKYGDLLWLRLGWTNTLVIQTAKAAELLFKNHDASFCDRKVPESLTAYNYYQGSISIGRYTPYWRILRRLVTLGLMTNKHIQEKVSLRRKCINDMIQFIQDDSEAAQWRGESGEVELPKYVLLMTFNLMGNLVLSRDLVNSQSEEGNDFFHAMDKVMELSGKPNLSDFFPFFRRLDPQRIKKNTEKQLGRTLSIIEKFVMERIEDRKLMKERNNKDLLDTFLEYNESGDGGREGHETISTHNILILIVEMFFGGTETTSATIEWVMTELFRNPESMRRVKEELNRVVGLKRNVKESDIDHLPYLQAVIKESMRLHPIVPLLVPRNALEHTNFMGYGIPKDTQVFVNTWAIGRDPEAWEDPLSFKPERFLGSNIQYRGQNFELLPFGSGRRICVGYPLAHQIIHLTIASLLHCFDWEIESKSVAEAMDINERLGMTVRKLIPLKAIPKKKIMAE